VPGFTEQEAYLYRVFETFDAGTFDWNAYQGTYKGGTACVVLEGDEGPASGGVSSLAMVV
jgi:hypothetical protein